jgi:initiation factor 1A
MPNTKGGKKGRKGKKNPNAAKPENFPKADVDGLLYAQVPDKLAGGMYIHVLCSDGKPRVAFIRGKFHKAKWIRPGNILLISTRPGLTTKEKEHCDIEHLYTDDQARKLKSIGEIDFEIKKDNGDADDSIVYDNELPSSDEDDEENPFSKLETADRSDKSKMRAEKEEKMKLRNKDRDGKSDRVENTVKVDQIITGVSDDDEEVETDFASI